MCGRGVLNSYYNIFIVKRRGKKNKKKTAGLANCAFSTKKINFTKNICEKYSHFTLYML